MNKAQLAYKIIQTLWEKGFEAYLAGGCVRDQLRGVPPKDFDIATSARPEQIQSLFAKTIPVGVAFGVVLVIEEGMPFEIATFRREGVYQDGRHPTEVAFTSVEEDARRRDFTVNGLYLDVRTQKVLDFVGGEADLGKKILRTIGDPTSRFLEDHLRLLRAVRFAVQLGFEIEDGTWKILCQHAEKIQSVSMERIREELSKILTSPNPGRGMRLLDECGMIQHILPELLLMKGVEQPMEYHPEGDVWIHTLMLLDQLKDAPVELAMGALLHDIAKPQTFVRAEDRIRFHGHDRIGADMAREICKRLTFSNDQTDLIVALVREHLRFKDAFQMRVSTLKRFLGIPRFDLHLALHKIDCMASHGKLDAHRFCTEKWEEFLKLPPPPSKLLTGDDLIALGFKPGKEFAKILTAMEDGVLEGAITNREEALAFVKKNFGKN